MASHWHVWLHWDESDAELGPSWIEVDEIGIGTIFTLFQLVQFDWCSKYLSLDFVVLVLYGVSITVPA